ncbi:MAG: UDP-N-acetylmuramoyl-L-alanine--D-glutamate ligase [bacterium]|nr:UDP-N-acetylmuramoyl-L-alanine--D-glutamate ligase [bacterium]
MKIAILGFGREGHSILKFLQKTRINADGNADIRRYKNISENLRKHRRESALREIWVLDKNRNAKVPRGIKTQLGKNYLKNLERFDVIFRSPGIPYLLPEVQKAEKVGVKISSATKLFFDEIEKRSRFGVRNPPTVIGITGTKGKGTTSTLLYKILKAAGKNVFLAGNIGLSMLEIIPRLSALSLRKSAPIVILELSSFQLQDLKKSPHIAAVLDIFPDHLDAHKNLKEYYDAKANIGRYQNPGDKIFFWGDNALSRKVASKGKGKKMAVYPSALLRTGEKSFKLFSPEDLLVKGTHNFKNAVMAANIAESFGVPRKIILKTTRGFHGTKHRLELARRIIKNGREICFYNDSASTNPQTAAAAVKAFPSEDKILIAGGQDKNLDYKPLAKALENSKTKLVILFGENKKKIEKTIKRMKNSELKIVRVNTLFQAIMFAYKFAKRLSIVHNSSFMVLFSPAATSFDMFENYADRGMKFKKIVKQLI